MCPAEVQDGVRHPFLCPVRLRALFSSGPLWGLTAPTLRLPAYSAEKKNQKQMMG
jgi:hypothetical protein